MLVHGGQGRILISLPFHNSNMQERSVEQDFLKCYLSLINVIAKKVAKGSRFHYQNFV